MGKVARSARAIMQTLWGDRGRPETNDYADRCAEQQLAKARAAGRSLVCVEEIKPAEPKIRESKRTADKWAAARAALHERHAREATSTRK